MKIKKLVSALSALTIAAGAFAGLAVTASAAGEETVPERINIVEDTNIEYWRTGNSPNYEYFDNTDLSGATSLNISNGLTNNSLWRAFAVLKFGNRTSSDNVSNATLHIYRDTSANSADTLTVYGTENADWSAADINWNTETSGGAKASYTGTNLGDMSVVLDSVPTVANGTTGWISFDVTSYVQQRNGGYSFLVTSNGTKGGSMASMEKDGGTYAAYLEITTTEEKTYSVSFDINGSLVTPTVKVYDDENRTIEHSGSSYTEGTYYYTATAVGYEDYNGSFSVSDDTANDGVVTVSIPMVAKSAAGSITVQYVNSQGNKLDENAEDVMDVSGKYVGDSLVTYLPAYYDTGSELYVYSALPEMTSGQGIGSWSEVAVTATADDQTLKYTYDRVDTDEYVLYEQNESGTPVYKNATSKGMFNNFGENSVDIVTVPSDGVYKLIVVSTIRDSTVSADMNMTVTLNETTEIGEINAKSTSPVPGIYEGIKLNEGDTISVSSNHARVGIDYAVLIKTAVAPTATYEQIGTDFTTSTGDSTVDSGSAFKLFVTAGTDVITNVGAKVNNVDSQNTIDTVINSGSTVTFAIAVNAAASDIDSIKAVINRTTEVEATKTTAIE